jgi:hypothetical protein
MLRRRFLILKSRRKEKRYRFRGEIIGLMDLPRLLDNVSLPTTPQAPHRSKKGF